MKCPGCGDDDMTDFGGGVFWCIWCEKTLKQLKREVEAKDGK